MKRYTWTLNEHNTTYETYHANVDDYLLAVSLVDGRWMWGVFEPAMQGGHRIAPEPDECVAPTLRGGQLDAEEWYEENVSRKDGAS